MSYICVILATAMLVGWIYIATKITADDLVELTIAVRKNAEIKLKETSKNKVKNLIKIENDGYSHRSRKYKKAVKKWDKKIAENTKNLEKVKSKQPDIIDIMPTGGYAFLREIKLDSDNKFYRSVISDFTRVSGKETAFIRAKKLIATMFTIAYLGILIGVSIVSILDSIGNPDAATMGGVVLFLSLILAYVPLNELQQASRLRGEKIDAEFPNAVSKLAMLTNSGMEVSHAWKITAYSQDGVLYEEMREAVEKQDNNVSPVKAYTDFMNNCNNKYTTKLATSIMQNLSKGNEEIGSLFIQLSDESWQERRHSARRIGEKAQSNLLLPTLMIFVGILALIIVPIFADMAGAF